MCQSYLQDNIKAQVFQYFAAFVVIAVNLMLEVGIPTAIINAILMYLLVHF